MWKHSIIFGLALMVIFGAGTSATATITGISSDGCAGATCQPSFVSPIVAGKQMSLTVKGQFVDLSTRVEISGSGVSVSFGNRVGGSNSSVVVKFNVDDSAGLGERTVKLRYAIETNGPDTFKVEVVRGGRVDQIQLSVAGTPVPANAVPVNQRVRFVLNGSRLGNALLAPNQSLNNPQTLSGCTDTSCGFEVEFTRTGTIDINLYDANVGTQAAALAINGTLYHFFYNGAPKITVVGVANTTVTVPINRALVGGSVAANPVFVDVAPRANILNLFRRTGNSITVNGQNFLEVEDRWCSENALQTPATGSASKQITIPDLQWGVTNVGTAEVTVAFDSQLIANNQVLQTGDVAAGVFLPLATHDFFFHRQHSTVHVVRFAAPNQPGCFARPSDPDFFEDPTFTVKVDVNNAVPETATNRINNARNF